MTDIQALQPAHTPGPWSVHQDHHSSSGYLVRGDGSRLILAYLPKVEDARLIAAAPELLAFVQEFLADYQSLEGMASMKYYAGKAYAAIAKATGAQA